MEKEQETEIVEGVVGKKVLDLARTALRKNKRRVRISKICSIVIPTLIGIVVVGTSLLMHYKNAANAIYWKNMIGIADINYNALIKEESVTIEELNKENKAKFYWIDQATITGTYLLKQEDSIILIEEHYLVDDVECVIYVKNKNSSIEEIEINENILNKTFVISETYKIKYESFKSYVYAKLSREYDYLFTINSLDNTLIETIFSNLTND